MFKKTILFTVVIILLPFTQSYCKDLEFQRNFEESFKFLKQKYLNELPLYEKVLLPLIRDINAIESELHEIELYSSKVYYTSGSYEKLTVWERFLHDSLSSDVDEAMEVLAELRFRAVITYMIKDIYRHEYFTSVLLPSIERLKNIGTVRSVSKKLTIQQHPVNEKLKRYLRKFEDIVISLNSLVKSYTPVIKSL
jgi:hypothetical protein